MQFILNGGDGGCRSGESGHFDGGRMECTAFHYGILAVLLLLNLTVFIHVQHGIEGDYIQIERNCQFFHVHANRGVDV